MLITEHTTTTTAKPKAIWKLYKDVQNWHTWDHELELVSLNGSFKAQATGKLRPLGGPEFPFILTKVIENECFVDETKLPLAKLRFTHIIKKSGNTTHVTHRIEVIGLLSLFFFCIFAKKMRKGLPEAMKNLVTKAESNIRET